MRLVASQWSSSSKKHEHMSGLSLRFTPNSMDSSWRSSIATCRLKRGWNCAASPEDRTSSTEAPSLRRWLCRAGSCEDSGWLPIHWSFQNEVYAPLPTWTCEIWRQAGRRPRRASQWLPVSTPCRLAMSTRSFVHATHDDSPGWCSQCSSFISRHAFCVSKSIWCRARHLPSEYTLSLTPLSTWRPSTRQI